MRLSLHRSLPLLALAGIGWLVWSAGQPGKRPTAGLLPQPQGAGRPKPGAKPAAKPAARPAARPGTKPTGKSAAKSALGDGPGTARAANSTAPATGFQPVRPAGPSQMKDPPQGWDEVDEENDESFPASDPPGRY